MSKSMYDLVVVGAGPYGLSVAAHAAAHGLRLRTFGRSMGSWHAMPSGMFLKSEPWASHLSDPEGAYGLDAYAAARGVRAAHGVPLPVDFFASYGDWFARRAVPALDERLIGTVAPAAGGFELLTEDGEALRARTVALAVGVLPFMEVPGPLRELPRRFVTHSSHHGELDRFAGRDVTVVGAGQAALETAALLVEQGAATVRILARADRLDWNTPPPALDRGLWPAVRPAHGARLRLAEQAVRGRPRGLPASADRHPRADLRLGAGPGGGLVAARALRGGRGRTSGAADHLGDRDPGRAAAARHGRAGRVDGPGDGPCGGGHRLHPGCGPGDRALPVLRASLRTVGGGGAPEVGGLFESSWPGLFLAGLLTAPSYGPSMRFVLGAEYTAGRLVRGVRQRLRAGARGGAVGRPRAGGKAPVAA